MKKLLFGLGICLILGMLLCYFTARSWARTQTLRAIESASGSEVQMRAFSMELWAGRVSLHEVILTPKEQTAPVEKVTVANASCQIRWTEWSSGIIPMEATLEDCSITLRQGDRIQFLKEHIRLPHQLTPPTAAVLDRSSEPRKSRIVLTALTAKNVTILGGTNQPALASGLNCAARRGMAGWHGELTAESLGLETLPLTHVQIEFSTETQGTRVAEFRCNLKEGTISGNGWCSNDGLISLDLQVNSLQLDSIAPTWFGNAISGMVSGSFTYNGDPICWQHGTIVGSFALTNGSLKLGAAAQMLSLLGGTTTRGALQLDSASATLTLTPEQWTLYQISMKKANLFEIEGQLSCDQAAKLKADLKLGISNQSPLSLGQSSSAAGQGEKLTWTPLQFEITPDQLWPGILSALLTPASAEPAQPAAQKPVLQEKAKAAVDAVMNILTR
jgi:hypothetical protein